MKIEFMRAGLLKSLAVICLLGGLAFLWVCGNGSDTGTDPSGSIEKSGMGTDPSGGGENPAMGTDPLGDGDNPAMGTDPSGDGENPAMGTDPSGDGFESFPNGVYNLEVSLSGGTGRASVQSPAKVTVVDGRATARIIWSSGNYDYMLVDGSRYDAVLVDGKSNFDIPITVINKEFTVIADTTAMGTPHEIEYRMMFYLGDSRDSLDENSSASDSKDFFNDKSLGGIVDKSSKKLSSAPAVIGGLSLSYADIFKVDYLEDGCSLITINGDEYLLIPPGQPIPYYAGTAGIIQQPVEGAYVAASSCLDLFLEIGALETVQFTGTTRDNWGVPGIQKAMNDGSLKYAGKYSAPDYELLIKSGCRLAIESTMISHSPQVREKLESLGITVITEYSSHESHPLGRMEWIKLYGVLTGREKEAETFFDNKTKELFKELNQGGGQTPDGGQTPGGGQTLDGGQTPKVVYFYITSNSAVAVRRPGDYITKMISMAGGEYFLPVEGDIKSGDAAVINLSREAFFEKARDADVLIYNSSIAGELESLSDLLAKDPILKNFKAVLENRVFSTKKNMFQQTGAMADIIREMNYIIKDDHTEELEYFARLD